MLHVTNGDSAGGSLERSGLPGQVLAWRDVLHDGPVPADISPQGLRTVRARFIADSGWGSYDDALASFSARDVALAEYAAYDEVALWFEHDLYDQLHLLQILNFFAGRDLGTTHLSLICIDSYPQVTPFYGLGQLTPEQLARLFPTRQPVTDEQLQIARRAWQAFRSPDPTAIETVLAADMTALQFLHDALLRHLEEFPSVEEGLARTEREILELVAAGEQRPASLFRAWMQRERAPFLGDASFFARIRTLSHGPHPLLRASGSADGIFTLPAEWNDPTPFHAQQLEATPTGRAVLSGEADWIHLAGIDRWLGGVHLLGPEAQWRWIRQDKRLVPLAG